MTCQYNLKSCIGQLVWRNKYKDYPVDARFHKSERKIVGCEMNEIYGWGESFHIPKEKESRLKKWLRRFKRGKK
ncbi:MAG: hypothetical protein H7A36_02460 [Chlamydiales bacterium]|nr:hypothetical protein [Chlamydiales bacterium]